MRYKIHTFAIIYKTTIRLHSSSKVNKYENIVLLILLGCGTSHITAQNDYLVTTIPNQEDPLSEEEQFIKENFPLQTFM